MLSILKYVPIQLFNSYVKPHDSYIYIYACNEDGFIYIISIIYAYSYTIGPGERK